MALTPSEALKLLDKLYSELKSRRPDIDKSFSYFKGEQPLVYATPEWRKFHQDRYRGFADNWCGVVARSPVDRLRLDGFRVGFDTDEFDAAERQLADDWKRNGMAVQSKQGFLASIIAKRSAVLVWGDENDEPVSTWEHPSQVIVGYAPGNRRKRVAALKTWKEDDTEYATLYLPDEVYKFQRPASGVEIVNGTTPAGLIVLPGFSLANGDWLKREVDGESWPITNPLGRVPVVEFENRPMLADEPLSDIQGTIAMQDAVNMLWAYMFAAADYASMPARVVLGAEPPKIPILDDLGQIIGATPAKLEDLAQGRLLFLPGVDGSARIDQWDAAKLDVFTHVIDKAVSHIAAQTSTPGHYLLSNEKFANLNGDALTAAETPLAMKVRAEQEFFDAPVCDVHELYALVRGDAKLAELCRVGDTQWKDAEMHALSQVADAATKDASVGIPLAYILERRYGLTQRDIDRVMKMKEAEAEDPVLSRILRDTAAPEAVPAPDANAGA